MTDIFPVSFLLAFSLIVLEKIRNKFGYLNLRKSIQTLHTKSVSRFGGIAVFGSLIVISFFSD